MQTCAERNPPVVHTLVMWHGGFELFLHRSMAKHHIWGFRHRLGNWQSHGFLSWESYVTTLTETAVESSTANTQAHTGPASFQRNQVAEPRFATSR